MTAEQFTYWLQGFMEIGNPDNLSTEETQIIKDHLALVFNKQTPIPQVNITTPSVDLNQTPPFFPSPFQPDWTWRPEQAPRFNVTCDTNDKPIC